MRASPSDDCCFVYSSDCFQECSNDEYCSKESGRYNWTVDDLPYDEPHCIWNSTMEKCMPDKGK